MRGGPPIRAILAAALAALALLALPAAGSAATAPPGFIGISPQSPPNEADYELMEEAGLQSLRLPLPWPQVEPVSPYARAPDWSVFDLAVGLAARHGMTVLPFVASTPRWVAPESTLEPARGWQLSAWTSFLSAAVHRYGDGGTFWSENPELPYLPVRAWEVWNEENIVTFGSADPERFASLLRTPGGRSTKPTPAPRCCSAASSAGRCRSRPTSAPATISTASTGPTT